MRSMLLAVLLALWGVAAHAQTQTLVDVATVSMSAPGIPRTVTDTVCATDGNDLVCDRGVYVTPAGQVGIGTATPSATLHVSGTGYFNDSLQVIKHNSPGGFSLTGYRTSTLGVAMSMQRARGSLNTPYSLVNGDRVGTLYFDAYNDSAAQFSTIAEITARVDGQIATASSTADAPGMIQLATTSDGSNVAAIRMTIRADGSVGISTSTPRTQLDVNGILRVASDPSATRNICDANRTGAIKYEGGDFSFCRNGSAWESLTGLGGGGALDRITSGTSAVVVNSATGVVSLTQAGTGWGYLAPSGFSYLPNLQTLSISATGPVNVQNDVAGGTNLSVRNNALNSSATAALSISANGAALGIIAINSSATYLAGSTGRPGGMAIYTSIGTEGGLTLASRHPSGSIYFYTGGTATQRMVLDGIGRLGIGTPSPNAKLDVSGTVSATDVFLAKTVGQCSTAADIGRMFRSATTGKLQICADRN